MSNDYDMPVIGGMGGMRGGMGGGMGGMRGGMGGMRGGMGGMRGGMGGMRGGMGGLGMRGGFRGGFPGRFGRFGAFPILFGPWAYPWYNTAYYPQTPCYTYDAYGRCCDAYGRCGGMYDGAYGNPVMGNPVMASVNDEEAQYVSGGLYDMELDGLDRY